MFFLVYYYCNRHNAAISLKSIHFIDKIKLILTLQVRNSITNLTITYMIQSRSISQRLFLYSYYQPPFACKGSNLFRAEGTIVSRAKYLLVAFFVTYIIFIKIKVLFSIFIEVVFLNCCLGQKTNKLYTK